MERFNEYSSDSHDEEALITEIPTLPKTETEKQTHKRLIIILEAANLDTIKTKSGIELINSDDHRKHIKKMGKSLEDFRPDITHQCLLALLDSPLNKCGRL